jgi:uncharacterized protein (DUF885 family)
MVINELADELVDVLVEEDPLNDFFGDQPGHEDRLPDPGEAAQARLAERAGDIARRAEGLDPSVTRGVLLHQAEAVITRAGSRLVEHTMWDFQVSPIAQLLGALPTRTGDFPARLAAIPAYLETVAQRHLAGVAAGRLPVASRVRTAVKRLDEHLADPQSDPLDRGPETERLLADVVRPAFARYRDVLAGLDGRPDEQPGLCWLPTNNYEALVRMHTTTGQTPEQLHQTGLEMIARLDGELARLGGAPADEVRDRIRTDPAMRYQSEDEVLAIARAALERAEQEAPKWFGRLPVKRCAVEPVPLGQAAGQSVAYYSPNTATYHANTYRWQERDRCVAEANAFHEAVPGHHFQIALSAELDLPRLRKVAYINAYFEGWSLYCEQLADEMGLYSDDIARLGMIANASLRAARLVVDTGLHAFGWSRRRTIDYLRANTPMNDVEIHQETNRYIENPGQALAYFAGRLEFDRIRARAQAGLGASFDVKDFHDVVLGTGPVPMPVLDDVVGEWMGL